MIEYPNSWWPPISDLEGSDLADLGHRNTPILRFSRKELCEFFHIEKMKNFANPENPSYKKQFDVQKNTKPDFWCSWTEISSFEDGDS